MRVLWAVSVPTARGRTGLAESSHAFPQTVQVGIRVAHLGTSSVRYEVGIFGESDTTAAKGHFVHVYVDKITRRPVPLPQRLKTVLEALQ